MSEGPKTDINQLSYDFAKRIVHLYRFLTEKAPVHEYNICNQLERAATSIGANVRESKYAQSRSDFLTKMTIALKEANESIYWLSLLRDGDYISNEQAESILNDASSIKRVLASIVKTTRESLDKP